ncbi:copper resistance CopC/CopD family protein [Paenibacillus radicis (ex Gao et al. 2016)]|uniref:copper resistance CopC/CopD family protein n=1 Tax=Paenibacillus radicis (ex Gao et al. 2016) TaxID=1737354 RepID=UPI0016644ECF|nr:copper resistance protein CopC [Paenibacillus radicis (ex Gao et al. 2016)]
MADEIPVSAHSSLASAVPAPDSRQEQAPEEIALTFNERIENKGFSLRVYNSKGLPVTEAEAVMNANRKGLRLQLPMLEDGAYTVTYRLLSADGHPVRASYVFTVGLAANANIGYASASQLHEEHDIRKNAGYWLIRGLYFMALLAVTGWIALRLYIPGFIAEYRRRYDRWRKLLLLIYVLALSLIAWKDYGKLSLGVESSERFTLLFGTSIGLSYLLSFILAVAGFVLLGRSKAADIGWTVLLLGAKGLNGHAMGFSLPFITYGLDVLHLAAASVWAGVLLLFLIFGLGRSRASLSAYMPVASQAALASIAALVLSGFAAAWLYTNGFTHLFETWWGKLMAAKAAAVLLVIAVGSLIRRQIKQRKMKRLSGWLGLDIALFLVIIAITGIFTYLNPLAATGPLFWHENVRGVHIAAIITPNEAGEVNQFNVSIGGGGKNEGDSGTDKVTLRLLFEDNPDIAPIEVPLQPVQTNGSPLSLYSSYYSAEGRYLALPGKWTLEVRVLQEGHSEPFLTRKAFYSEMKPKSDGD